MLPLRDQEREPEKDRGRRTQGAPESTNQEPDAAAWRRWEPGTRRELGSHPELGHPGPGHQEQDRPSGLLGAG